MDINICQNILTAANMRDRYMSDFIAIAYHDSRSEAYVIFDLSLQKNIHVVKIITSVNGLAKKSYEEDIPYSVESWNSIINKYKKQGYKYEIVKSKTGNLELVRLNGEFIKKMCELSALIDKALEKWEKSTFYGSAKLVLKYYIDQYETDGIISEEGMVTMNQYYNSVRNDLDIQ